jgi:hypothetical protein
MKPPSIRTGSSAARGHRPGFRVALLLAALAALAIPSSAQALGVSGTAAPTDLQAGAHSNFDINVNFTAPGDDVENLTIGLPPGLVGDPNATPFCAVSDLNADSCPDNTIVGTVVTNVTALGILPLSVSGNLYNVEPQAGEPARFGIALHALPITVPVLGDVLVPPIILQSGVKLRQTDFGLDTVIEDIPNTAEVLSLGGVPLLTAPIDITSMEVGLLGEAPGTGKPFLRNPTSCVPAHATFTADSYTGSTATTPVTANSSPDFTPTGCGNLPFSPTFSARMGSPGQNAPLGKPPVSTVIEQDAGEAGLAQAEVLLPPDLGVDLAQLNESCPLDVFNAAACPPNTVIGSAVATSPLITQPLTGPVVLVQQAVLPDIGLNLAGPLTLNLHGTLAISGSVTFGGLPDIPISHFELNFVGGADGLNVANRDLCVPPAPLFHENFTGHNGATTSLETSATIEGCGPVLGKCAKSKAKKKKKGKKSEATAAKKKKGKKKSCKKKKKKKRKKR